MILGTPVIAITILLLAFERLAHVGIFDPANGGDPVLFQHLFWFYSHPAVYIMVLPGMGVISELIANFSRKNIFGYTFVAFSSLAIAVFGFLVWGHHLFVASQSVYAGMIFSFLSFAVAIPSAIKVFNWTATLYKGSISYDTPMLYALGFIGLFTIGGMTGLFLAALAVDVHLSDTYFVVAHFHYIMVGGTLFGLPRRIALLVAQDYRAHVSGRLGQIFGAGGFRRVQPDVPAAVCRRLPGHAAALSRLSAGVSGVQCVVVGGRFDSWRGLVDSVDLSGVVHALRQTRGSKSVALAGPGMANCFAAAD